MSIHSLANYQIIKLTSKLRDQGWTYQQLEDLIDLPDDPMQIEIRQYRKAINYLKFIYILGLNKLNNYE